MSHAAAQQLARPTHPAPSPEDVRTLNERITATSALITRLYEELREATENREALIESRDQLLTKRDRVFQTLMRDEEHRDALAEALTGDAPLPDKLAAGMRLVQDDDEEHAPEPPNCPCHPSVMMDFVDAPNHPHFRCPKCGETSLIAADRMHDVVSFERLKARGWDTVKGMLDRRLTPDPDFAETVVREAAQDVANQLAEARAADPDCAAAPLTMTEQIAAGPKPISYEMTCATCGRDFRVPIPARHCPACVAAEYVHQERHDDDDLSEHDSNGNA